MRIEFLSPGLALALATVLAGCATATPAAPGAPVVMPAPASEPLAPAAVQTEPAAARSAGAPADAVLAYGERIRGLPPAELAQEVQRLSDSPYTPARALQLAIALALQRNPAQAPRVQSLLQRVLAQQDAEAQALHPLARLLAEQRRLEEQLERQGQQLRDTQRRVEQLNERLEAVRAIERSLPAQPAREPGAAPARPAASRPAASRPAP